MLGITGRFLPKERLYAGFLRYTIVEGQGQLNRKMNPEWESKVREYTLNESQMDFVFLPSKALDFFRNEDCVPVVFLLGEEPVGFFVLHNSE